MKSPESKCSLIVFLVFVSTVGCWRAGDTTSTNTNTTDDVPAASTAPKTDRALDSQASPTTSVESSATSSADIPKEKPIDGTKHRVMLFPPDGPLLMELDIAVADRPLDGWSDSMVDDATRLSDLNDDGLVTWDELFESDAVQDRYFSESSPLDEGLDSVKTQYDLNKNDLLDRYEFPQLLTGGMSNGRSFGLRSSNYYREVNRYAAPLFRFLDTNTSGGLSRSELERAAGLLGARDFDNDEYIELADLPLVDANPGEMRNNTYQPHVAVWFGPRDPWDRVRLAMTELYADGDLISPDHFTLTPELFEQLDANSDGRFSLRELSALTEIPPHIRLRVRLSSTNPNTPILSGVEVCESLERAGVQIHDEPPWLRFLLPNSRVDMFVREMPIANPTEQAAALLQKVDTDKNEYVDLAEYEAAADSWESEFEDLDVDDNNMIYLDELVPVFQTTQTFAGSQVRAHVAHRPDALFASLDSNNDLRLAASELDNLTTVLAGLDADSDGQLTPNELPDYLIMGLSQGGDQQANNLLSDAPAPKTQATGEIPAWFQAMDHNGDGLISMREFLGKKAKFDELDQDNNQYLELNEIE